MGRQMTFGVIVGNRGFFPSHLAAAGRTEIIAALERQGHKAIVTSVEETAFGAVETYKEAMICAELFQRHAGDIDGIIITLPNFGEERGIADAIRLANLQVPILIQATPDDAGKMTIAFRRDSFCGKMSICNNLRQYGIPFTLTSLAHGGTGLRGVRARPRDICSRPAVLFAAFGTCVSARLEHVRQRSTRCATRRSCWRGAALPSTR